MASLLFREMKASNFSCSSPASSYVCTSIDRRSIVSLGCGRPIDRPIPLLKNSLRSCSLRHLSQRPTKRRPCDQKSWKSTETQLDLISSSSLSCGRRRNEEKQQELISPWNSSRYLSNDADGSFFNASSYPKQVLALPPLERNETAAILGPSSSAVIQDQIVVLRVSLYCKGCERKVRRHISKLEGVTSFSIDLSTKKVVVIGNVTPLGVLNSVSKVKNAEFWSWPQPL